MTYENLRREFVKPSFREELKNKLGGICVNCESDENIEYHHIVPLKNGGTNKLSNIVPLCVECHEKAHDKEGFKSRGGGRPKVISYEDAEPILHRYFNLEIGTKETKRLLGLSETTKSTWYKLTNEYKNKYNIKKFYNKIDLYYAQNKKLKV